MARTISDLLPGTQVYVNETVDGTTNPVSYIYLGLDESNKARLLREHPVERKRMNSSNVAYYSGCEMDVWLENDFLTRFDEATLGVIENTSIIFKDYSQTTYNVAQLVTVNRKCFLMSSTEYGFDPSVVGSEGQSYITALRAFYDTNDDKTARICYLESGTSANVWIRSAYSVTDFYIVANNGLRQGVHASLNVIYSRPVIAISSVTPVSDDGSNPIFILPDGKDTYWKIQATMSLGQTVNRPKQAKLYIDADPFYEEHYWVCNNYGDAVPTWISCTNTGSCVLGETKTTAYWELGVKIDVKSKDPTYSVGEPALIVEFEEA